LFASKKFREFVLANSNDEAIWPPPTESRLVGIQVLFDRNQLPLLSVDDPKRIGVMINENFFPIDHHTAACANGGQR
jgi:hypothetical protein